MNDMSTPDTYGGGYSVIASDSKIRIRDMIASIEFMEASPDAWLCPVCRNPRDYGHVDDCELAWALRVLRAGGTEK